MSPGVSSNKRRIVLAVLAAMLPALSATVAAATPTAVAPQASTDGPSRPIDRVAFDAALLAAYTDMARDVAMVRKNREARRLHGKK